MSCWVLRDSPARGFYEAMGGRPLETKMIEISGCALEEVRYVWDDLSVVVRQSAYCYLREAGIRVSLPWLF